MCKINPLKQFINITFLLFFTFVLIGCKTTKYVPNDRSLLKKNIITYQKKVFQEDDILSIIRQSPNRKFVGIKWNLLLFNALDSSSIALKRTHKNYKLRQINLKRKEKENRINFHRIKKAKSKGELEYVRKYIPLKDTLEPNLFLKEWLKYKIGEPPVVFDSLYFNKSIEQLNALLKNKGFYYGNVEGKVHYKKHQKSKVFYRINSGLPYVIDSVYLKSENEVVKNLFHEFELNNSLNNQVFESGKLENYRNTLSKYFRNKGVYNFNSSFISFLVDTNKRKMNVSLGIIISEKLITDEGTKDSLVYKSHEKVYVQDVHFHIIDTMFMAGTFFATLDSLNIQKVGKYLPTLDTLFFNGVKKRNSKEFNLNRAVYFYYNGDLFLSPDVLESQSLVERDKILSEEFIEETYTRFQGLSLFNTIKIEIVEIEGTNRVHVHYYLLPSKKESFSFQPRISSSNGYLGISAGLNYTNKNLFKGAEKLTFGLNGGFQSQPVIFEETEETNDLVNVTTRLYQFEIGPTMKLELPGLLLIKNSKLNKSRNGKTLMSSSYSYQNRDVFAKEIFQLNYTWQYNVGNHQKFQMGLPGLSQIKFVSINKSADFESKLIELNDLFLRNTYSNQFIWQDWKLIFEYKTDVKSDKRYFSTFYMRSSLDLAGNLLHLFKKYQTQDSIGQFAGQSRLFGLVYSQFTRLDNEMIFSKPLNNTKSLNMRLLTGAGLPYGNSNTSMPYDYSFYAGGSNDVRGWRARSLGPGSYAYYLDTGRTIVQVADIRLSASAEYRFQFSDFLKGALFVDAGNIWTLRDDNNRVGSKFSKNWYKEIALASGIGFRMDFDYFIIRFDLGFKLHNPGLPKGSKWVFQSRDKFNQRIADFIQENKDNGITVTESKLVTTPFTPQISFGIGYPF